jgi:hypothetical protein
VDPTCAEIRETFVYFFASFPEDVCCPVGDEGCASSGPAGGWAIDRDSCPVLVPELGDRYYRKYVDPRGCAYLGWDDDQCCGCSDAGVEP